MMKLTKMEKMVLNATRKNEFQDCYTDEYTWAFAVIQNSGLEEKAAGGVVSSLIKKGLVGFQEDEDEDIIWLTEEGKKLFEEADGEECSWGGPRLLKVEEDKVEEKKMTVAEMRKEASAMGIKGVRGMKKAELEKALEAAKTTGTKKVTMVAFTGMLLGEFEVVEEDKNTLTVMTKKGELTFSKKTGIQLNPRNEKFANHIQWA